MTCFQRESTDCPNGGDSIISLDELKVILEAISIVVNVIGIATTIYLYVKGK